VDSALATLLRPNYESGAVRPFILLRQLLVLSHFYRARWSASTAFVGGVVCTVPDAALWVPVSVLSSDYCVDRNFVRRGCCGLVGVLRRP
jgi:hypothetical protein